MIIVRLTGGLGNQMFQYALGRNLSHRLQTTLKLDISMFKHNPARLYSLKHFNIREEFASTMEIYRFSGVPQTVVQKIVHRFNRHFSSVLEVLSSSLIYSRNNLSDNQPLVYPEPHFHFDPDVLNVRGDIYLKGYWQSEKYFEEIKEIIRKEFSVKRPLEGKNLQLAQQIQGCESVSLHVRRGDYVSSTKWRDTHGVCPVQYYNTAIQILKDNKSNLRFFIFSDDPKWVKDYLQVGHHCIIVDHNGPKEAHEDLRLMTLCQNHILANSTFSWWGAWLRSGQAGIVIAPRRWFGEERMRTRILVDLFIDGWYVL